MVALFSTAASIAAATVVGSAPTSGKTTIWLASSSAWSDSATSGGRSPRYSAWAVESGMKPFVSGELRVGCRVPRTSKDSPRMSTVPPATTPYLRAMVDPRTTTLPVSSAMSWRPVASSSVNVSNPPSAPGMVPTRKSGAPNPIAGSGSHGISTLGWTAPTPSRPAMISTSSRRIGDEPKAMPSVTTILSAKYSLPMPTRPLIWLASELNTTSAQMPMVMPVMVRLVRSLRRESSRRIRMTTLLSG